MTSPFTAGGPSVLLVEPDILVRSPLAEYLRDCGYRVLEAVNGDEARQLLKDGTLAVDIVLADIDRANDTRSNDTRLNDLHGFALAAWIRNNHPGVDMILAGTVAKAVDKAGDLCREGPALVKPYDHKLVLDTIRRLRAARDRARNTNKGGPDRNT